MRIPRKGGRGASYTWTFPICPHAVVIDLSVISALQHDIEERRDVQQGLLFGQTSSGATQIDGYAPLPRLEAGEFVKALEHGRRKVVGYYRIREGSAFILTGEEIRLAKELQRPGSVVLLIERRAAGPAEGTFCFWRGESFVTNLPLPFPIHPVLLGGGPEWEQAAEVAEPTAAAAEPTRIRSKAPRRRAGLGVGQVALMAAGVIAGVALGATLLRNPQRGQPAGSANLRPDSGTSHLPPELRGQVEITWDPRAPAVATAMAGQLKIDDGGVKRLIPLNAVELGFGSVLYSPVSDRLTIDLTTRQKDGRMGKAEAVAHPFVPMAPSPEVSKPTPPPPAVALPTATIPLPIKDSGAANGASPVKITPPVPDTARAAEVAPPPNVAARPTAKAFTWPSADRSTTAGTSAPVVLDPPAIQDHPAVQVATGAIPLAPSLPVPPPPPPVARSTAPHSGRLIWTGTLLRRGVVELDGRNVSVGSLNGGLPGVPVNVTVSPAEFSDHGLVVYVTDPKRNNRVEPPSAANGWNQINYVWDPERVRQVAILETPNASNRYSRLAVRNDARRCSMMFIDWVAR
jgi:hypothetical protein